MADAMTALHQLVCVLLGTALGTRATDPDFFRPAGQRKPAGATNAPFATVASLTNEMAMFNLRRWDPLNPAVAAVIPEDFEADLAEILETIDQVTVSVQFWRDGAVDGVGRTVWGEGAMARANTVVRRLEMSDVVEVANQLGLGYANASKVRDVSGVVDGNYERRAQVDLTFYFSDAAVAAVNMFRSATLDVQVQQPDGHISEVST